MGLIKGGCASAVIVTYFPDVDFFDRLVKLSKIINKIYVVDNTPEVSPILNRCLPDNVKINYLKENKGIAEALNLGADQAFSDKAEFVFFFDQDSNPDQSMIDALIAVSSGFEDSNVAVVGPAYFDTRLAKKAPFITFKNGRLCRVPAEGNQLIEADYLITSGSIISRKSWESIGPHDDSLFIDYVDIEWCLRAKSLGWRVIGVPYVVMEHTLGDEPISVFGKKLPVHSPIRHYYFFRNCISLLRRDYIPSGFKLREFCFLPIRFFVYSLFTKNKFSHIAKMSKGLLDGILSKSGPYQ
jgi:rhamnosyltransferase